MDCALPGFLHNMRCNPNRRSVYGELVAIWSHDDVGYFVVSGSHRLAQHGKLTSIQPRLSVAGFRCGWQQVGVGALEPSRAPASRLVSRLRPGRPLSGGQVSVLVRIYAPAAEYQSSVPTFPKSGQLLHLRSGHRHVAKEVSPDLKVEVRSKPNGAFYLNTFR